MQYVKLGKTGLKVSRICLGMMSFGDPTISKWTLPLENAKPIVKRALDLGINFFDTANVYSYGKSEEITGEVLSDVRDEIIVATKVFFPLKGFNVDSKPNQSGLSRYHIRRALDDSLNRLKMKTIDLYQIHRLDSSIPIEDVLRTLNNLIEDGKVLHIGASSMFAWQFVKSFWMADKYGLEGFKTMQNHYNLIYREEEREMIPFCKDQEVGIIPWSPLARGFLTGKYNDNQNIDSARLKHDRYLSNRYFKDEDFKVVSRVIEIAQEKSVSAAQIALAWLFSKSEITAPILGVTKIEHLEEAVDALNIRLSADDIDRLEEVYIPHPIIGHS